MQLVSWWLWIAVAVAAVQWNPAGIADHGTIEILTVAPDEGEHWSTVWFVVIDGNIYLRLGPRAAARIEKNSTAPRLKLRVSGKALSVSTSGSGRGRAPKMPRSQAEDPYA